MDAEFEQRRSTEVAQIAERFRGERGRGSGLAAEGLAAVCAALREGDVETLIVGDLNDATVVTGKDRTDRGPRAPTCCPNWAKPYTEWCGPMRRCHS